MVVYGCSVIYLPQYPYSYIHDLLIIYITVKFVDFGYIYIYIYIYMCVHLGTSHKCTDYQGILVLQISLAI